MFVPIIMTLDPTSELSWMWVFHKMASMGKGYQWPIVAQKEYFDGYKTFEVPSISKELFDVSLDKEGVLENILPIEIPEYIINNYIEQFPSRTDAYVNSFVDEWPEIVDYLYEKLNKIRVNSGRAIEGLLLFKYYRCFESLSDKLKIPTFYFELGALRIPDYRNTFYWSKKGLMGKAGFKEKFDKFHQEFMENPILILDAKEILALFLKEDKLEYLNMPTFKDYEFGILGGYSVPVPSTHFNGITLAEELMLVRKLCTDDKIIIKKHQGDPLDAAPRFSNVEESGVTSAQFIQKCKRIVCASSNVTFEAALYGVPAYDLGWSQYSFISNSSLEELADVLPDKIKLSFIAFGCLAPLELLKDIEYIRKAINLDSELEMYKLNLEYYLRDYGLTYKQLVDSDNRLELILKSRLHKQFKHLEVMPKGTLTPVAELQIELRNIQRRLNREREQNQINRDLETELELLKEKYMILENDNNTLQIKNENNINDLNVLNDLNAAMSLKLQDMERLCSEKDALYHQIIESTSFRCTKPLRVLARLFKI
ncbi:GT99 family glycosyltransferase N-terminal domain-containing protein [Lacrimispora sp.]|uniref:GT99 family glycosyltransferase N-terminal domain-containing protein n=1 Tax=Lacrimispora sp. TaxID=2719234 RepID=UPI002896BA92|nr:hypothetical protein [Lacrimispora sp.]